MPPLIRPLLASSSRVHRCAQDCIDYGQSSAQTAGFLSFLLCGFRGALSSKAGLTRRYTLPEDTIFEEEFIRPSQALELPLQEFSRSPGKS